MDERWVPVIGWEGLYEVSDLGRVQRLGRQRGTRGGVMKTPLDRQGRPQLNLCRGGVRIHVLAHRLVAEAFLGPRPRGLVCRHLDGNASNNAASNLAWGTGSENNYDSVRHGTWTNRYVGQTHCQHGHEFTPDNTRIVPQNSGRGTFRQCIECVKRRNREQSARRKAARAARQATYGER